MPDKKPQEPNPFKRFFHTLFLHHPWLRITSAILLLFLGVLGIIIPLAPGIPFILLGLYLLNPIWYKKTYHRIREKFRKPK